MAEDKKLRDLLTAVIGGTDGVDGFFAGEALRLTFSDAPAVSLELSEDGGLFAYSLLVRIPEEPEAARDLVLHALELNLPGFLDHGCFFSAHDGMIAVFSACGYGGMDEKEFKDFLGKFAAQAQELLTELNDFVSSLTKTGTGAGAGGAASADETRPSQGWIMA